MRIMLTGATGFVGRHLYLSLIDSHELHILTRPSSDVSELSFARRYVYDDIDSLADYMANERIDGVIHLAAFYVAEHRSEQISELFNSNIYFSTAVLEAAVKAGVKWFINTGTIWQNYNVPDYSDEYNPVNLYAATKQAFITLAKYYTETSPIRFVTLKLCDTYGPGDTRRKIVNLFDEIAKSGETLKMSPGEQLIDIVHIDKVVEEFEKLLSLISDPSAQLCPEYVVTSGRRITLRQLAEEYERKHDVKLNIEWGARPYRRREVMKPYLGVPIIGSLKSHKGTHYELLTKFNTGGGG